MAAKVEGIQEFSLEEYELLWTVGEGAFGRVDFYQRKGTFTSLFQPKENDTGGAQRMQDEAIFSRTKPFPSTLFLL